jgi:hypothetical protein
MAACLPYADADPLASALPALRKKKPATVPLACSSNMTVQRARMFRAGLLDVSEFKTAHTMTSQRKRLNGTKQPLTSDRRVRSVVNHCSLACLDASLRQVTLRATAFTQAIKRALLSFRSAFWS